MSGQITCPGSLGCLHRLGVAQPEVRYLRAAAPKSAILPAANKVTLFRGSGESVRSAATSGVAAQSLQHVGGRVSRLKAAQKRYDLVSGVEAGLAEQAGPRPRADPEPPGQCGEPLRTAAFKDAFQAAQHGIDCCTFKTWDTVSVIDPRALGDWITTYRRLRYIHHVQAATCSTRAFLVELVNGKQPGVASGRPWPSHAAATLRP